MLSLEVLQEKLNESLKAHDEVTAGTLRMLLARVKSLAKDSGGELTEAQIQELASSELKKRKEAIKLYEEGGRQELADKEKAEVTVLESLLPARMSILEVEKVVNEYLGAGQYTMKDMGSIIKALKDKYGQSIDGSDLATAVKSNLTA